MGRTHDGTIAGAMTIGHRLLRNFLNPAKHLRCRSLVTADHRVNNVDSHKRNEMSQRRYLAFLYRLIERQRDLCEQDTNLLLLTLACGGRRAQIDQGLLGGVKKIKSAR